MKLRSFTYKAWWDLHAWAGLLVSLIAYVMFFFGTVTLFHANLAGWQEPRKPPPRSSYVDRLIDEGIERKQISADGWYGIHVTLPSSISAGFRLQYEDPKGERHDMLAERSGLVERRSNLALFFYGMHYLQFPSAPEWLYTVAGLASGLLLLVVVSGVLIHLRDIVSQLHQFRPTKGLRVAWSDAHKVLATIGLPFAIVYAFTGAWLGLGSLVTERLTKVSFRGDEQAWALALSGPAAPEVKPTTATAPRARLENLLAIAERAAFSLRANSNGLVECVSVVLNQTGSRDATASFDCGDEGVVLRQRDGSRVVDAAIAPEVPPTLAQRIEEVPYAMHFVQFAKLPLRALYAMLGLAGAASILTGNWIWLARRRPGRTTWLLQRLTLAVGAGCPLAAASALFINRISPSLAAEQRAFWWAWLGVCVVSAVGKNAASHWPRLLAVTSVVLMLVPLIDWLGRAEIYQRWPASRMELGVDVTLFVLSIALALLSRGLFRYSRAATSEPIVVTPSETPISVA